MVRPHGRALRRDCRVFHCVALSAMTLCSAWGRCRGCVRSFSAGASARGSSSASIAVCRRARADEARTGLEDALSSVQQQVTGVVETPARLQKEAQKTVEETLKSLQKDDGRILDPDTPAGAVGSLAVSLAVLPYVPLSLYSTYLLYTTGRGVPPGVNGIQGLAEGAATLVMFAVVLWSLISFLTRARGLPAGPFNILGATQALSFLASVALLTVSFIKGGNSAPIISGLKNANLPMPSLPPISVPEFPKVQLPTPELPKFGDLGRDSSNFIANLQEGIAEKVGSVKQRVSAGTGSAVDKLGSLALQVPMVPSAFEKSSVKPAGTAQEASERASEQTPSKIELEDLL
eukprot:CAMPEP_0171090688 /NCGR_PEP_ID=MMETSP0766_2-20121228/32005_1 /TAXON_ID=439317 /ORGANISM="Gambierdiscus australes, Strain CAWD 149" /LENGTH=346 /DNA_ID=CAMNT_0011548713 /DNA_START=26 /DNA_END=1066 /DNA_ORIENTATION=+